MTYTILREGYPKRHSCDLPRQRAFGPRIKEGTVVKCDECGRIQEWRYINNRWQWGSSHYYES